MFIYLKICYFLKIFIKKLSTFKGNRVKIILKNKNGKKIKA